MTTTYAQIASTFTDTDDSVARLATMDAVAEAEAGKNIDPVLAAKLQAMTSEEFDAYIANRCQPECPRCNGRGYVGAGTMTMTPSGPEDDTESCDYCDGSGKCPELVRPEWACPECGENRQDCLTNDSGEITCDTCAHTYSIERVGIEDY